MCADKVVCFFWQNKVIFDNNSSGTLSFLFATPLQENQAN